MKRIATAACMALAAAAPAHAQYPERTIKIILPLSVGGTAFFTMRAFADEWQKILGVPVIVEAKPGALGTIAADTLMHARPDGYTVGYVLRTMISPNDKYNPLELKYATYIAHNELYLVVRADSPATSVADVLRENLSLYGASSVGARTAGAQLAKETGVPLQLYPSSQETLLSDILSGRVAFGLIFDAAGRAAIESGQLRALAIVGPAHSDFMPNLPTIAQALEAAGRKPYKVMNFYTAMAFPPGTPERIVRTLSDATCEALKSPTLKARIARLKDIKVSCSTPEEMQKLAEESYDESKHYHWP
jgi:tripartite-type tricarboxylate transporter receptor subunit TctC